MKQAWAYRAIAFFKMGWPELEPLWAKPRSEPHRFRVFAKRSNPGHPKFFRPS
jgi:hypothetical protein